MNAHEWTAAFAARLGTVTPTNEECEQLLALAGVAAHASERVAAPISCWIAANAGVTPEIALEHARAVSADG